MLDEVDTMIREVRAYPLWGETLITHPEARGEIEETMGQLAELAESSETSRGILVDTFNSIPLTLPDEAYPDVMLEAAHQMLAAANQIHGTVLAILNVFRKYYGQGESTGSSLN